MLHKKRIATNILNLFAHHRENFDQFDPTFLQLVSRRKSYKHLLDMNKSYQYQPAPPHQEYTHHQGIGSFSPRLEHATQP